MTPDNSLPSSPIKNVFVLMLENHSFDNMLALSGIPGIEAATTSDQNSFTERKKPHAVCTCRFGPGAPPGMPTDPGHEFPDVFQQLTGEKLKLPLPSTYPPINNSGFAENYNTTRSEGKRPHEGEVCDIMLGFETAQALPVLSQLANSFAVCDHWFSSLPGPTWPNRFFLHGASSNGLDHSPTSADILLWETIDGFRYPNGSIFDAMNAQGITWRLYHDKNGPLEGTISQVSSLHNVELWQVHPLANFETEVQSPSYPYQYTFIEPNYGDIAGGTYENGTSQHPMDGVAGGEQLIASVYNALRKSPIWKQSLFVITYDEHGGFYDHFPPPGAIAPGDGGMEYSDFGFNFKQYGVRVPALIISPYVEAGVDQTRYDHTSVLATVESLFGLSSLTDRDGNANTLKLTNIFRDDTPESVTPAPAGPSRAPISEAERTARESEPIPEGSTLTGMLGVVLKAHSKLEGSAMARAEFATLQTRGRARAYIHRVLAKVEAFRATLGER